MIRLIAVLSLCLFGAMYFIPSGESAGEVAEVAQAESLPNEIPQGIQIASLEGDTPLLLAAAQAGEAPEAEPAAAEAFPPAKRVAKMTSAPIEPAMLSLGKSDAPAGYVPQGKTAQNTAVSEADGDVWYVTGTSVNMRAGPSTANAVLAALPRGAAAEMITQEGNGWARIRDLSSGQTGYMSARFLSRAAP